MRIDGGWRPLRPDPRSGDLIPATDSITADYVARLVSARSVLLIRTNPCSVVPPGHLCGSNQRKENV